MAWDFSTDPEFQKKLDWADAFVREQVESSTSSTRSSTTRRRPAR